MPDMFLQLSGILALIISGVVRPDLSFPVCSTCYGILMLLPQSHAFKTLHARLHSVPTQALLHMESLPLHSSPPDSPPGSTDLQPLLELFRQRQVCTLVAWPSEWGLHVDVTNCFPRF